MFSLQEKDLNHPKANKWGEMLHPVFCFIQSAIDFFRADFYVIENALNRCSERSREQGQVVKVLK